MLRYLNITILILSGLLITSVSAFFSIKGFVLFLPDTELYYGILGIGIGFELAKIVMSTFLFHKIKDRAFPIFIKSIMFLSVISLIFFSSIFTFVHLNASASQNLSTTQVNNVQIERLIEKNNILNKRVDVINSEINQVNASDKPNTKLRIYNALSPEKDKITEEIEVNLLKLTTLENQTMENNQYTILESISKFSNYKKEDIFTYIILFIVIILDPLAISLLLAGSYIISEKPTIKVNKKNKVLDTAIKPLFTPPNFLKVPEPVTYKPSYFTTSYSSPSNVEELEDRINKVLPEIETKFNINSPSVHRKKKVIVEEPEIIVEKSFYDLSLLQFDYINEELLEAEVKDLSQINTVNLEDNDSDMPSNEFIIKKIKVKVK